MINCVRGMTRNGKMVVTAIDATEIVRKMEEIHCTSAPVTAALGRLLTAAALMGSQQKGESNSITLRVAGGGPAGTLVAVSDALGNVRGYAEHPRADAPLRDDGKLNVGGVVGRDGTLSVIRDTGAGEPYIGQIPLVSGEIAEDITSYYATSEQTPCVSALGVVVNPDLSVRAAAGYLLHLLPGASDYDIDSAEKAIIEAGSATNLLNTAGDAKSMLSMLLGSFDWDVVDERTVEYRCSCSKERTEGILRSLGQEELRQMLDESPCAEVACHFCNETYEIPLAPLLENV